MLSGILGLEDEIEQHRDQLDRHRLELVRLVADRRFLDVAQTLCMSCCRPADCTGARRIEAALAVLKAAERVAQFRRHQDARPPEGPMVGAAGGAAWPLIAPPIPGTESAGPPLPDGRVRCNTAAADAMPRRACSSCIPRAFAAATRAACPGSPAVEAPPSGRCPAGERGWRLGLRVRRLAVGDLHARPTSRGSRSRSAAWNDLQILEMTVQVGVDLVDIPERGLVELLEHSRA